MIRVEHSGKSEQSLVTAGAVKLTSRKLPSVPAVHHGENATTALKTRQTRTRHHSTAPPTKPPQLPKARAFSPQSHDQPKKQTGDWATGLTQQYSSSSQLYCTPSSAFQWGGWGSATLSEQSRYDDRTVTRHRSHWGHRTQRPPNKGQKKECVRYHKEQQLRRHTEEDRQGYDALRTSLLSLLLQLECKDRVV